MSVAAPSSTEIAIVGGGPVGLVLALYLDLYGVKSVLFNSEPTTRWHPKGNIHNARTMEHYRKLGIADRVRRLGLPGDHPFDTAYFTRLSTYEIARFHTPSPDERMALRATRPATDQLPEPTHRVNQMYVERFLLEYARTRPNITLRFGCTMEEFSADEGGVSLDVRDESGAPQAWRAQYLVGCDGSRSAVRNALGIRYEAEDDLMGAFMDGRFVSIHMKIPTLYRDALGDRRAWMYLTINPDARAVIITLDGRGEFMMHNPDNQGEIVDEANVIRRVQRAIGKTIPVEILGHRPWNAGGYLVAERFQSGRVLMAGDAVHLFTPTGGFGLNTGVDDTANLAWKLAATLQGWGGKALLDSYETERKPVAVRNTSVGRAMGKAWRDLTVTSVIEEATPAGAAARQEAARSPFVTDNHFVLPEERDCLGIVLGARYDGSPIIVADGTAPAADIERYTPSDVPGGRTPHLWLDDDHEAGSSLYDRLGIGFTLLRCGGKSGDSGPLEAAARARGIPLKVLDLDDGRAGMLYERRLILIRPDHHVAWRGDRLPDDAQSLLAQIIGD